jgi:aminoglycoside phosphotransferase family enzyme
VNSFQVDDSTIRSEDKDKAVQSAKKYFSLACSYTQS